MKSFTKQIIICITIAILIAGIGVFIGYNIKKNPKQNIVVIDNTKEDSLRFELNKSNLEKQIYKNSIDSLNKIINFNRIQYEIEVKTINDINIISDDSITRYISNYLHSK